MRSVLIVLCLVATSARAQPSSAPAPVAPESVPPPPLISAPQAPEAPPEAPEASPEPPPAPHEAQPAPPEARPAPIEEAPGESTLPSPPLPGYTGPALPASERVPRYVNPGRHSLYSAGPGGLTLFLTELISGAVGGGLVGAAQQEGSGAFPTAVLGAVTLGTAGALYQYFARVEQNEAWLTAGAAAAGFITGFGVASERGMSREDRAILTLATTQLSVITTLAITSSRLGDVSTGDTLLIGMTSLYAFIFTGCMQLALDTSSADSDATPTLAAPTLGMLAGALLAIPLELEPEVVAALTVIPIGVTLGVLRAADSLSNAATGTVMLVSISGAFLLTAAFIYFSDTSTPEELSRASGFQAVPIPVVVPAGRRNDSLAAGPGLLMRF